MKQSTKTLTALSIIACIILAMIASADIANFVLSFLIAGALPGTGISLPFWAMLIFYIVMICLVALLFTGSAQRDAKLYHQNVRKQRHMPRRRYSHI